MTHGKIAKLESIGFKWKLKVDAVEAWDAQFDELVQFKELYGHCDALSTWENQTLANWVKKQRRDHKLAKNGNKSPIMDEQIKRLENIGFRWTINNTKGRLSGARDYV